MMNLKDKRTKKIVSTVVVIILVAAMILPMISAIYSVI